MQSKPETGGKPEWLESPEFKDAVAQGVAAAMSELAKVRGGDAVPSASDNDWIRRLALSIGEISQQGTGRKPWDPAVLQARETAASKMRSLLIQHRERARSWIGEGENPHVPTYKLRHKVQLNLGEVGEAVVDPQWVGNDHILYPTIIAFDGVPNMAMVPVNEAAEQVFALFADSIGNTPEELANADAKFRAAVLMGEAALSTPVAVTPGGVSITGTTSQTMATRREAPHVGMPGPVGRQGETAAVIRRHQPAAKIETRVLGTLAPPAVQNA